MEYLIRVGNKYVSGFCSETGLPILTQESSARVYQENVVGLAMGNVMKYYCDVELQVLPEVL